MPPKQELAFIEDLALSKTVKCSVGSAHPDRLRQARPCPTIRISCMIARDLALTGRLCSHSWRNSAPSVCRARDTPWGGPVSPPPILAPVSRTHRLLRAGCSGGSSPATETSIFFGTCFRPTKKQLASRKNSAFLRCAAWCEWPYRLLLIAQSRTLLRFLPSLDSNSVRIRGEV